MITSRSTQVNAIDSIRRSTLTRRLLVSIFPLVVGSLTAAGGIGYLVSSNSGRNAELTRVQDDSNMIALSTRTLLTNEQNVISNIRQSPGVLELFKKARAAAEEQKLSQLNLNQAATVKELEKRFRSTRQILPTPLINQYLKRLETEKGVDEIIIADNRGLTLAAGTPTSDFVQTDDKWWQQANENGFYLGKPEFDESTQQRTMTIAQRVYDAQKREVIGVVKLGVKPRILQKEISKYVADTMKNTETVQLIDSTNGAVFTTITKETLKQDAAPTAEEEVILGGDLIKQLTAQVMRGSLGGLDDGGVKAFEQNLQELGNVAVIRTLVQGEGENKSITGLQVRIDDRYFSLTPVPETNLVSVTSESTAEVNQAGNQTLQAFVGTTVFLGLLSTLVVLLLARNLARPLIALTETAEAAAGGKLDLRVTSQEGTEEIQTLGQSFNHLLDEVQNLIQKQESLAKEQGRLRDELEGDVMQLMDDVGDASDGDLTVRAQLSASDVGIVADLFNSVIENLRDTAVQVKTASGQVSMSLDVNAEGIRSLATQAITEADALRQTMNSVEEVSDSIRTVAGNAEQASKITDETYATVQDGSEYMDKTVDSILGLRSTVGETAKKIKRLGESAQKISQTVTLIDEIALKTNLLAVNASVEAARAGELGQGFTAVAEQVGALAEQSAAATKEIAQIVTAIQAETQEVVGAIETGTAQVVDSTQLVETTKQRLTDVLQKSAQINELMRSISESTTAQTAAAAVVNDQVKSATLESEQRAKASEQMAKAIQDTADIARSLEESVAGFKVDEELVVESDENDSTQPSIEVPAEEMVESSAMA